MIQTNKHEQAKKHRLIAKNVSVGKAIEMSKLPPYNANIRIAGSEFKVSKETGKTREKA